jgi:hypothetical protein
MSVLTVLGYKNFSLECTMSKSSYKICLGYVFNLIVEQRVEIKMQLKELEQFNKKHKEKQKVTHDKLKVGNKNKLICFRIRRKLKITFHI